MPRPTGLSVMPREFVSESEVPDRAKWADFVLECRARPGEWTVAGKFDTEHQARSLHYHLRRHYGLQCRTRKRDLSWTVWASWPAVAA